MLRRLCTLALLSFAFAAPAASAATPLAPSAGAAGTLVDLSAEASRPAANDLARATLFAEASSTSPGESAKRVNAQIAEAIATARSYTRVRTQSGTTHTYPVTGKSGKIESWRMRSEIVLESGDTAALSELVGKLQATLGVAGLSLQPAHETRKKAENDAMLDAIAAFRARARLVADALGKPYRIRQLSVGAQGFRPPMPVMRAAAMATMDAAPMPVEAGESQVSATVSGQIELID